MDEIALVWAFGSRTSAPMKLKNNSSMDLLTQRARESRCFSCRNAGVCGTFILKCTLLFYQALVDSDYDFFYKFRCFVPGPFPHRAPLVFAQFKTQPALFGDESVVWWLASEGKPICFAKKSSEWCQMESLLGGS